MALLPAIPLIIGGCEDGPTQTFSPAPSGAGNIWNGSNGSGGLGDGGANVPTGTQEFDASFGGTNANQLCTADVAKATWARLFPAPILIPGVAAGIDAAGGPNSDCASGYVSDTQSPPWTYNPLKESWSGCTVEQVEKILCQGVAFQEFIGLTNELAWGEADEFAVLYNTSNRIVTDLLFNQGFPGAMTATTADGKTTYYVPMSNTWMTKSVNGGAPQNIVIDWTNKTALDGLVDSMYDAFRTTYAPYIQPDLHCGTDGSCPIGINGVAGGYFFFAPIGLAIFVNQTIGSPAVQSYPFIIQVSVLKQLPFSAGDNMMQFDSAGLGPTSTTVKPGGTLGNQGTCTYQLGMTFKDFNSQCVSVYASSDPNQSSDNTIAINKLFGGMNHSDEAFAFDVIGVDPNFAASSLKSNEVISDTQRPADTDVAYEFAIDQYSTGKIANDYTNNDPTQPQDWHGIGMVTLEWANLIQQYAQRTAGVNTQLGDPACIAYEGALFNDPTTKPPAGKVCSGMEGIVTSAPLALAGNQYKVNALGGSAMSMPQMPSGGLHPGTWYSLFCFDGAGLTASGNPNGYNNCVGSTNNFPTPTGVTPAYYFDTAQKMANLTFGGNAPGDLGRLRFYWKEWILAFVKYLQTADNPAATLAQIDANPVDANNIFFDSAGGGFEQAEFIYRGLVNSKQQAPLDIEIPINLQTSALSSFNFSRYLFRGESMLYKVLQTNPTDALGAEPLYLANMVGSPVLTSVYGTYACAVNTDPAQCNGVLGEIDPLTNQPQWTGYQAAFGQTFLNIAALNNIPLASPMSVNPTDYELIQSAMVTVPIWSNPYDPTTATANDKTAQYLLPYVPAGSTVGFPVNIDGSRDKFYNTNMTAIGGVTFGGDLDWEYVAGTDADGGATQNLVIRAFEAQDYLGLIPFCYSANGATGKKDLLSIRMYDDGQTIVNWIGAHPTAVTDCGITIKYSIYGNYPDFITSLTNGVRISLNAAFGGSVVSDMTVFDPNIVASLGQ